MRWNVREGTEPPIYPCKVYDDDTGEYVPMVFCVDTVTLEVGRYDLDENGQVQLTDDRKDVKVIWETRRVRLEPIEEISPSVIVEASQT